jgi:hypothetical protein
MICSLMPAQQDKDWEQVSEKDQIKVYTKEVQGHKVKSMKMTCQIDGESLSSFVAVFQDMSSYPDWVYSSSEPGLLERISDQEIYYYVRSKFPWPLSDRDFVVHNKVWQDPETHTFYSRSKVLNDYLDEVDGVVRINEFEAAWEITPLSNGRYDLEYTFYTDPGGNIPNWLVNHFLDIGPFKTIKSLEAEAQKPKYSNASFTFVNEPKF